MPTIVKQGNADWPYTVTHRCGNCGTEYRLERGDRFDCLARGYEGMVLSFCPTCHRLVYTKSPHMR